MLTPTTLPIQDRIPGVPIGSDTEDILLAETKAPPTPGPTEAQAPLAAAKEYAAPRTNYTGRIRDSSKCSARTPW